MLITVYILKLKWIFFFFYKISVKDCIFFLFRTPSITFVHLSRVRSA